MQAEEAAPGAVDRRGLPVDEHAALRRIATLIAEGAPVAELFQALSQEVVKVLGVRAVTIDRYDHDGTTTTVGALSSGALQVGTRWPLEDGSLAAMVFETGRPARIDDYGGLAGPGATAIRSSGFLRAVAAPVMVDGVVWGMLWVGTDASEPLPAGLETRLLDFTELIAVAVSNADARDRLRRSAEQEASLRRVATLVAQGASPNEPFSAVAEELARILNVLSVSLIRYELDGTSIVLASFNDPSFRVNSRWPQDGHSLNSMVLETARPARIDDYSALPGPVAEAARASGVQSGIGAPIVVDGEVWGMIAVGRRQHREVLPDFTGSYTSRMMFSTESPEGIESRLAAFTELVGTAISRAQAQDQLHQLATEQAALRRVATLVAQGADSQVVFDAVCEETCSLVGASTVNLSQFTSDGFNLTRAGWSLRDTHVLVGTRLPIAPDDTVDGMVKQSGGPARIDGYDGAASELATLVRDRGLRSSVAAPVFVGGQLWGALVASTDAGEVLPRHTEVQLASFTELIATAVSNAATHSELIASRARIVAAGDEERRRIERNLHDGTQQRLLALGLEMQVLRAGIPPDDRAQEGIDRVVHELEAVLQEVRELSRGLHPALLTRGGLRPSLRALARRSPIPVELRVDVGERPPPSIETAVYYVVSEVITNAIKHSQASKIIVVVTSRESDLRASISDDGVGGAEAGDGSGLVGLADRVEALGGRIALESPVGGGTKISVDLPFKS